MEPSSSSDPAITLLAPSSPGTEAHQDKSNCSDLIQIDREEGAAGGEKRLSEEKEESDHRISEGGADKNEEDFEQNLDEHHHAPEKTASASASTAPTPLVEVDWDLLTTGESAPLLEASTSSSSTHPVDVRSRNKGKEKEAYQMDGHGGEVLVASPRPASPPLDVVAPTFRVRLDSRELASSDIVVEETSSPSTLSSMALLEAKRKQQRHTVTHLPRQGHPGSGDDAESEEHAGDAQHADGAAHGTQQRQRSYSLSDPHKKEDGAHYFYPTSFARTTACNVCHKPLRGLAKQGLACSICQYAVHYSCEEKSEHCCPITYSRPSSLEKMKQMEHAWIEGNVEAGTECRACKKEILALDPMAASRCFWCGGAAHNGCKENTLKCDMGPHKDFKLPPYALFKHTSPGGGGEKWVIEPSLLPEGCVPYLVFVNKKAGGQQGKLVFRNMLSLFNPHQVFDLSQGGPMPGLRMFFPLARRGPGFRIMVCGGDGTVNWVCQTLARVKFPRPEFAPPLALLPLGTGNDLSGYLGWGVGYTGGDLNDYLLQLHHTEIVKLDRWKSTIANFGAPDEREDSGAGLTPIDAPIPKNVRKLSTQPPQQPQQQQADQSEHSTPVSTITNIMSSLWPSSSSGVGGRKELVQDDSHPHEEEQQNQDVEQDRLSKEEEEEVVLVDDEEEGDIELEEEEDTVSGVDFKSFHHSFSIGVDAKITWNFHLAREANPENFTSRGMNKFKYFTQGVSSIIDGGCKGLAQAIEFIEVDGHIIWGDELPQGIESLIFGNIPAYADGTDLWAKPTGDFKAQRVDDKVVEVIAHKGSLHLVQIKAGVSRAYQLGQGRRIKMQTRDVLPMQLDGEPWLQGPALIQIEHRNQVSMIVPKNRKNKSA
jgi:diacylglycerol kinase (ATP)